MKTVLSSILSSLNMIEVKGQTNLALLYNAIDSVKGLIAEIDKHAPLKEDNQDA
jgi:PIN domain nuclease of toxin-antitoxin system